MVNTTASRGWQCPMCGKVHAPWVPDCRCDNHIDKYTGDDAHLVELVAKIYEQKVPEDELPEEEIPQTQKEVNAIIEVLGNVGYSMKEIGCGIKNPLQI